MRIAATPGEREAAGALRGTSVPSPGRRPPLFLVLSLLLALPLIACDREGTTAPLSARTFQDLALGRDHTCALDTDGMVHCWGANGRGQLGDGKPGPSTPVPRKVAREMTYMGVALGWDHSCAVIDGGGALCWGSNEAGRLGDGTNTHRPVPTFVADDHPFVEIAAGFGHTCALTPEGRAWCWGAGGRGELGVGAPVDRALRPVPVASDRRFTSLSAGGHHTCGIALDATLWCWGQNGSGQIGDGTTDDALEPVQVQGLSGVMEVTAGWTHTCARLSGGALHCWGGNWWGQLGRGGSGPGQPDPEPVSRNLLWSQASAGAEYSCGVTTGGPAFCWGRNVDGQLGDPRLVSWTIPQTLMSVDGAVFRRIETGLGTHTCALTVRDAVYCWGRGESGELGNLSTTFSTTPVRVELP